MKDMRERLEDLLVDAAECDLIANLTIDKDKRALFRSLADQYRTMAMAVRSVIEARPAEFVTSPSISPSQISDD